MAIFTTKFIDLADAGINDNWFQKPGSASVLTNWRWDPRGGWETVGGFAPILAPIAAVPRFSGGDAIDSLAWFSRHNGAQQYIVYETGGSLRFIVGSGVTGWETLATGRFTTALPWQKTQYAAWANWLYIVNGVDEPIRWNGRDIVRCGFDKPAPKPELWHKDSGMVKTHTTVSGLGLGSTGSGTNNIDVESKYRYSLTLRNDLGCESPLSDLTDEASWTIHGGDSQDTDAYPGARFMVALDLPAGPSCAKSKVVYRTRNFCDEPAGSSRTLYFCREIGHNVQDIWIDAVPDDVLGSEIDQSQFGAWPKGAKYIAFFKSTCFLAGMPEYPDRVAWSRAGQPENFPPDNFFQLGDLDSSEITAMRSTKNALIVFKRRGIYLIRGDPLNGFFAYTMSEDVGCSCPNALADLPGRGLMFVSEQGVYLLEGAHEGGEQVTQIRPMSQTIQDLWRDVNTHALMNACGAFYHRDREYWLAVPMWGSTVPNRVLVYHYETDAWSGRPNIPVNCLTETRDHRGYLLFGSTHSGAASATNHPGIHVWSQGWPDYDGGSPTKVYESCWLDFRRLYEYVNVQHVYLYVIGYDGTATLDYYTDRRIVAERARMGEVGDPRTQQDESLDYTTWGEGTWNDGLTLMKWRPVVLRFDIDAVDIACREFKFKVTITGRGQILGYDVEITQDGTREFLPLNTLIGGTAP